jgi:hypothetical protein
MAVVLALEDLYSKVTARFLADGRGPTVVYQPFGWREPAKQRTTSERIVWVPGDDESGELGKLGPARYPGRNPRPLATLGELFTCYIAAQDPSDPTNEAKQYRATRLLFDEWTRALYLAARDTFTIVRSTWVLDKTQFRHGAAIRSLGAIQSMIPDYTHEAAPTDTKARVTLVELDHSEQFDVEAPP